MTVPEPQWHKPFLYHFRSSKLFVYIVVNLAVFTDAYLYGLIIPVLPFALVSRVNLEESQVQRWIGILLAAYGGGLIVGSRMSVSICCFSRQISDYADSVLSIGCGIGDRTGQAACVKAWIRLCCPVIQCTGLCRSIML